MQSSGGGGTQQGDLSLLGWRAGLLKSNMWVLGLIRRGAEIGLLCASLGWATKILQILPRRFTRMFWKGAGSLPQSERLAYASLVPLGPFWGGVYIEYWLAVLFLDRRLAKGTRGGHAQIIGD